MCSYLVIEQMVMRPIKTYAGLTRGQGVSESVCHMWTLTLNHNSSLHCAMVDLTGMVVKTNNQHVYITEPRQKQD